MTTIANADIAGFAAQHHVRLDTPVGGVTSVLVAAFNERGNVVAQLQNSGACQAVMTASAVAFRIVSRTTIRLAIVGICMEKAGFVATLQGQFNGTHATVNNPAAVKFPRGQPFDQSFEISAVVMCSDTSSVVLVGGSYGLVMDEKSLLRVGEAFLAVVHTDSGNVCAMQRWGTGHSVVKHLFPLAEGLLLVLFVVALTNAVQTAHLSESSPLLAAQCLTAIQNSSGLIGLSTNSNSRLAPARASTLNANTLTINALVTLFLMRS